MGIEKRGIKITAEIPEELWVRLKMRIVVERSNMRTLLIQGLELRLAQKPTKAGGRR
jgi:hypothetical protein